MKPQNTHHAIPIVLNDPPEAAISPVELSGLPGGTAAIPDPQWVRGKCPQCGGTLVSNMYLQPGKGFIVVWDCGNRRNVPLGDPPSYDYRREL